MGFEPTRAEHIGIAVQRLNHSATSSSVTSHHIVRQQLRTPIQGCLFLIQWNNGADEVRIKASFVLFYSFFCLSMAHNSQHKSRLHILYK